MNGGTVGVRESGNRREGVGGWDMLSEPDPLTEG